MRLTVNLVALLGGVLAWHWYGWHLFVVAVLLTSEISSSDIPFHLRMVFWESKEKNLPK